MKQIILASGSPRRREIMEQVDLVFQVIVSNMEEIITKVNPHEVVMELAAMKADHIAGQVKEDAFIIGADTVVAIGDKILGKPSDSNEASLMLNSLSGTIHSVFTGVCIISVNDGVVVDKKVFYEETKVTMYPITQEELERYIAGDEPYDKAGGYGMQGKAAAFIKKIDGDYYNAIGLPISRLLQELKGIK